MLAADDSSAAVAAALGAPSSHHLLAPVVAIAMAQRTGPGAGPAAAAAPRRRYDAARYDASPAHEYTHTHTCRHAVAASDGLTRSLSTSMSEEFEGLHTWRQFPYVIAEV
jgi:hypothetical protein